MAALYITSSENGSGKTTVCAGIGKLLMADGKKVGYFKPIISDGTQTTSEADGDAGFMKSLFSLDGSAETLSPVISSRGNLAGNIKEVYAKASQGKDVMIVEGISDQNWASREIAETLDAGIIVVEAYSEGLLKAVENARDMGKPLLGIIITKVPKNRLEQARADVSATGVNVLGMLPEDRVLSAMSIGELTESIHGEILRGAEHSDELVENIMLGAYAVDPGPEYFSRKENKAVVLKSSRPDMQMAAMETSSRCLVLTGDTPLNPTVIDRAEEKDIPIIIAGDNTDTIVASIEETLLKTRFHQETKLARLTELIEQNVDVPAVTKGLG